MASIRLHPLGRTFYGFCQMHDDMYCFLFSPPRFPKQHTKLPLQYLQSPMPCRRQAVANLGFTLPAPPPSQSQARVSGTVVGAHPTHPQRCHPSCHLLASDPALLRYSEQPLTRSTLSPSVPACTSESRGPRQG